jgi:hypothetical protein
MAPARRAGREVDRLRLASNHFKFCAFEGSQQDHKPPGCVPAGFQSASRLMFMSRVLTSPF